MRKHLKGFKEFFSMTIYRDTIAARLLLISEISMDNLMGVIAEYYDEILNLEEDADWNKSRWKHVGVALHEMEDTDSLINMLMKYCLSTLSYRHEQLEQLLWSEFLSHAKSKRKASLKSYRERAEKRVQQGHSMSPMTFNKRPAECLEEAYLIAAGVLVLDKMEAARYPRVDITEIVRCYLLDKKLELGFVTMYLRALQYNVLAEKSRLNISKKEKEIKTLKNEIKNAQKTISNQTTQITRNDEEIRHLRLEVKETGNKEKIEELQVLLNTCEFQLAQKDDEIVKLSKELSMNNSEIENLKRYKDFVELLEKGNSEDEETESSETLDIDFSDMFVGKRVVIFGGHSNWRERMEQELRRQRIPCLLVDTKIHGGLPKVGKGDFVIVNVLCISHTFYYRIMAHISKESQVVRITSASVAKARQKIAEELLRSA